MGDDVVSTYLRRKLSSNLKEAEEELGRSSSIISRFRSLEKEMKNSTEDELYEVIRALSECRVISYKRSTAKAAVSEKGFFYFIHVLHRPLSELLDKKSMSKKLIAIEKKINSPSAADASAQAPVPQSETTSISKKGFFIHVVLSLLLFKRWMRKRLDDNKKDLGVHSSAGSPAPRPPVVPYTYISDIIGFEEQVAKIEACLIPSSSNTFKEIVITGKWGCGKTALARKVLDTPAIKRGFSLPPIWVYLSDTMQEQKQKQELEQEQEQEQEHPAIKRGFSLPPIWVCLSDTMQEQEQERKGKQEQERKREQEQEQEQEQKRKQKAKDIVMSCIQRDFQNMLDELKGDMWDELKGKDMLDVLKGKRYLMVLDDVSWHWPGGLNLDLPKESGGALILTTRQNKDDYGTDHVIKLEPRLSDDIIWKIFCQEAQLNHNGEPLLPITRNDVKRISGGRALAVKSLGTRITPLLERMEYRIRARELGITWGDDTRYWSWTTEEVEEVAELVDVYWLEITGSLELNKLMLNKSYSAYLVYKLDEERYGLDVEMEARVRIVSKGKEKPLLEKEGTVYIDGDDSQAREIGSGWMEIKLGEFRNEKDFRDDGSAQVEARLFEGECWKSGLVVKGITFRPSTEMKLRSPTN